MTESRHSFSPDTMSPEGFAAKQATRQQTLDLLKESDYWVPDSTGGYLNGDWVELCGKPDETLKTLLSQNVLRPGLSRYIGINLDPEVIQFNREHYKKETEAGLAVWVDGAWANIFADRNRYPNARVVVFDSFNAIINERLDRILRDSLDFAELLYKRNGMVILVVNLTGRGSTPEKIQNRVQKLMSWKESVCKGNFTKPIFKTYTSKVMPMCITWLPLGF